MPILLSSNKEATFFQEGAPPTPSLNFMQHLSRKIDSSGGTFLQTAANSVPPGRLPAHLTAFTLLPPFMPEAVEIQVRFR